MINLDCKKISNALTNVAVKKVLAHLGYSRQLCRFVFIESDDTTPAEYLEMAEKAHSMGMTIDVDEFKRMTGLSFIKTSVEGD